MNISRIRIGIIGGGWIVENAYLPTLSNIDEAEVVAVMDTDRERAKSICNKFMIKNAVNNWADFIKIGIDAVIIATPNFTHFDYSLKALESGLHVLCEKPVAFSAREVLQIINASKKNNLIYMPGFVNRWRDDIQEVLKIVQSGQIGKIKSIDAGWIRKNGVPRPGTWFTNKALSGGGALIDIGTHVIDICLMLLGDMDSLNYELNTSLLDAKRKEVVAKWFQMNYKPEIDINVEDTAIAKIEYINDTVLNVNVSWCAKAEGDSTFFKIKGNKGEIQLQTLFGFSNDRLYADNTLKVTIGDYSFKKQFDDNRYDVFRKMNSSFIQSILNNEAVYINGEDALKTVSIIEKLYKVENK